MFDGNNPDPSADPASSPSAGPASSSSAEPDSPPDDGPDPPPNDTESTLEAAQKDADANFPATPVQSVSSPCGSPPPSPPSKDPSTPKTWIEYHLVDDKGKAVPGVRYRVKSPDGSMIDGAFDERGKARIPTIDPGNCKIWILDVDGQEWKKG